MSDLEVNSLDWQKMNGLLPAIVQHAENGKVLLLGYMNREALIATITTGQLTLYSRSRQRLWRKGDASGNNMAIQHIGTDCDNDSLLIQVLPKGPSCHLGHHTCYQPQYSSLLASVDGLIELINEQAEQNDEDNYITQLLNAGVARCAQKVGEEAIETVIAASLENKEDLINESADLIFHLLVLLKNSGLSVYDVLQCVQERKTKIEAALC